jgi:hypothetical protein
MPKHSSLPGLPGWGEAKTQALHLKKRISQKWISFSYFAVY